MHIEFKGQKPLEGLLLMPRLHALAVPIDIHVYIIYIAICRTSVVGMLRMHDPHACVYLNRAWLMYSPTMLSIVW